ncbi:MAG: cytochrome c biogenesis CcdA family protein [Candidatus Rokuibacteriota bacterium]
MGAAVLSFFAGTLSVLSPCVLPLLPIVVASALQRHRFGPLALAGGLVLASAATGLAFASLGFAAGVDRDTARAVAASLMVLIGIVLLVPRLREVAARVTGPLARGASALTTPGLGGQFVLGLLLGAVWTPCSGPTLAAAVTLAARSEDLAHAGVVMLFFGIGAVVPVLGVAYGSRRVLTASEPSLVRVAAIGPPVMGALLLLVGVLAFSGTDKAIEAWLVAHMPDWLVDLTTWL